MATATIEDTRLDAIVSSWLWNLSRSNEVLAGYPVPVKLGSGHPSAAWTDGTEVTFNQSVIMKETTACAASGEWRQFTLRIKGLNYHEFSHILWSPKKGSWWNRRLEASGRPMQHVENMLEDQRIETFTTAMWLPTAAYFRAMIYRFLLDNDEAENLWLLLHGRKHIPTDIRVKARSEFDLVDAQLADELADLIDEYIGLDIERSSHEEPAKVSDTYRGWEILQRVLDIIGDDAAMDVPQPTGGRNTDAGQSGDEQSTDGLPAQIAIMVQEALDEETDGDGEGAEGPQEGSDGDPGSQDGVSLSEAVSEALDDLSDDSRLGKEISNTIKSVLKHAEEAAYDTTKQNDASGRQRPVPAEVRAVSARVANLLKTLKADTEPEWQRKVDHGRLNPMRYMTGRIGALDIFDLYDEGAEEEATVEVVMVVDRSISMNGKKMNDASLALWAIKRALDEHHIPTTALIFDTASYVGYHPVDHVPHQQYKDFTAGGSTHPLASLTTAHRILARSQATHQFCIVVTDGQWGGYGQSEAEIEAMNKEGVLTCLYGLDNAVTRYGHHACKVSHDIAQAIDLIAATSKLVEEAVRGHKSYR